MYVIKKRWPEAEESIVKYCGQYDIESYIDKYVKTRSLPIESLIIKDLVTDDKTSILVATYFRKIQQRIPAIEHAVLNSKDPSGIINYAIFCIKGQWLEGEKRLVEIINKNILIYDTYYLQYLEYLSKHKNIKSKNYLIKIIDLLEKNGVNINKDYINNLIKYLDLI
jgi:hypothetical protein